MKDRIQVDGVWYVRESSTLPIVEIEEMFVTNTLGCIWESDNWCFQYYGSCTDGRERCDAKRCRPFYGSHRQNVQCDTNRFRYYLTTL